MINLISEMIVRLILLIALVIFAVYGVTQVPKIAGVLSDRMARAADVK